MIITVMDITMTVIECDNHHYNCHPLQWPSPATAITATVIHCKDYHPPRRSQQGPTYSYINDVLALAPTFIKPIGT